MVVAVRGPLLVFLLPAARARAARARPRRPRACSSFLLRPRVAFGLWAANLAVWHIPSLYDAALRHPCLHDLEHACWVLAGLLVWTLLVDPGSHTAAHASAAASRSRRRCSRAGQVLTDVLVFSFHPLYPVYHGAYGFSARTDQQLAGVVMMVEQLLDARDARRSCCCARACATRAWSPRERDELQLRARVPRARGSPPRRRTRGRRGTTARRRGAPRVFAVGLFLIAASLNSPLETIAAKRLLLVHLLQNALIADIAPLLILLGLTPAMRAWLDAHGARRIRARYALPAWLARLVRHAPRGLLRLGARHRLGAQHRARASSSLGGLALLVAARLGPARRRRPRSRISARASSRSSFLGLALIFSSRPFYSFYEHDAAALGPLARCATRTSAAS